MAPIRSGLSLRWALSVRVVSWRGHFCDVDHPFASFHFHNCFPSARLSCFSRRTGCGLMDARLDSAFLHGEMISSSFSAPDHVSLLDSWIMDRFKASPCPGSLLLKSVLREVLIYWDWSHIIWVSSYASLLSFSHIPSLSVILHLALSLSSFMTPFIPWQSPHGPLFLTLSLYSWFTLIH